MYQEVHEFFYVEVDGITKCRGLPIKKTLSSFYMDSKFQKDAQDLCREMLEAAMETIPALCNRNSSSSQGEDVA